MTKKDLNNWIMYYEIHKLKRLGFSSSKIGRHLVMDERTVSKYLQMSEQDFEDSLILFTERNKILSPYENFVKEKLNLFQDTSAAQIHDWLLEHHKNLPQVGSRTVYNFVMYVRRKHNIPVMPAIREYFPVAESAYGEQAQVDFGDYNMRFGEGSRKKVKFFVMVLSRSRMKYLWFLDTPFTSQSVAAAHENAFAFFGGIPKTIVYDQDRTMIVDENIGEVILTATFKQYIKSRNFKLHFCRKSDPESKGKVENAVGYIKKNFLYNRVYSEIETLNSEAIAWLGRTANFLAHNFTKKSPESEFKIEKEYLNPYTPIIIENKEIKMHHLRKTNTIAYKGNFYTVPMGTYQGTGTQVIVKENKNTVEIYTLKDELICTHNLSSQKGQTIANTNHRRDTSKSLGELFNQAVLFFSNENLAKTYLQKIKEKFPRYTRDHLLVIIKAVTDVDKMTADKTLAFCVTNTLENANEFEQVLEVFLLEKINPLKKQVPMKLLDETNLQKANQTPEIRSMLDYENIINQ
jgi:transposase